jgi:hypothetical protein
MEPPRFRALFLGPEPGHPPRDAIAMALNIDQDERPLPLENLIRALGAALRAVGALLCARRWPIPVDEDPRDALVVSGLEGQTPAKRPPRNL